MNADTLPLDLELPRAPKARIAIGANAAVLTAFAAREASLLVRALREVCRDAHLRHMVTPGGWTMSVAMTNCGEVGWVTDRSGYRYDRLDPVSGRPWPSMPALFSHLAASAAAEVGFNAFAPDVCLINQYEPGARLSLHQDRDECDYASPIVSVSLGLPAIFLWGGNERTQRPIRLPLMHGDVVVWGGADRLNFHGVHTLADGQHPLTGHVRYNLTFRTARGTPPVQAARTDRR